MKHSRIAGPSAHEAARQVEQELRRGPGAGGSATPPQGHHRGYAFRPGRAPAAPGRRPAALRGRPRPRAAQGGQVDQEDDRDLDIGREADETAIADKRQAGPAREADDRDPGAAPDDGSKPSRPPWLLKPPGPRPAPTEALDRGLAQAGGAPAEALLKASSHRTADHAGELADALVATWVSTLRASASERAAAPPVAALQAHALRAYLFSGAQGALSTVAAVKQLLLRHVRKDQLAAGGEPQQNGRLLLPLALLNADRPRTQRQCGEACERQALAHLPMGVKA